MGEYVVPEFEWDLMGQHRQERVAGEDRNRNRNQQFDLTSNSNGSPHVQQQQICSFQQNLILPMTSMKSSHRVEELTWENVQLAMHGHGGSVLPATAPSSKPIWGSGDMLGSVVHQSASTSSGPKHSRYLVDNNVPTANNNLIHRELVKIAKRNTGGHSESENTVPELNKWARPESARRGTNPSHNKFLSASYNNRDGRGERKNKLNTNRSKCASASAAFCREDHDSTMMTWASLESLRTFKAGKSGYDDSTADSPVESENQDGDQETKAETDRSCLSKRSRASAVHSQSERRRRDRINQKMKTLQRMVPNARKTDKASMLDEVIKYLKQLQAQVQMMNTIRNINSLPQMTTMMPIGVSPQHYQLQTSLLSRMSGAGAGIGLGMGTGLGMGMLDMNSMMSRGAAASQPLPLSPILHPIPAAFGSTPPFVVPPASHSLPSAQGRADAWNNASALHLPNLYYALLAQKMNIELYGKMAAVYGERRTSSSSHPNEAAMNKSE